MKAPEDEDYMKFKEFSQFVFRLMEKHLRIAQAIYPAIMRSVFSQMKTPEGFDYSLITYVDILGFRAKLLKSLRVEIERLVNEASRRMQICGLSITAAANQLKYPSRRICHFQDSFVGVVELGWAADTPKEIQDMLHEYGCALFTQEIENICNIQMNFIRKQVLIRGAVAAGPVAIIGESVLGTGFVRVYDLEHGKAKHPRVVVAPELLGVLDQHPLAKPFLERALTRDEDGEVFVNYLWGSSLCYLRFQDYLDLLKEHQDAILELQRDSGKIEGLEKKLTWLIEYHNKEVERVAGLIRQRYTCDPREWAIPPVPHPSSDKENTW